MVAFERIWVLARAAQIRRKAKTVNSGFACSRPENGSDTNRPPSFITLYRKTGFKKSISWTGGLIRRALISWHSGFRIPSGVSRGYRYDYFVVLQYGRFDG